MAEKMNWVVLALVAVVVYFVVTHGAAVTPTNPTQPTNPVQPSGTSCALTPTVGNLSTDAILLGTAVTPTTASFVVNNQYVGAAQPSPVVGANWQVLANAAGYLPDVETLTVGCGPNNIAYKFFSYANFSVTMKDDQTVGTSTALTQNIAGGAKNATNVSVGGYRNYVMVLTGQVQKSTGNVIYVFEGPAGSSSNITAVTLTCDKVTPTITPVPQGYVATGNGFKAAYLIPAVTGPVVSTCTLNVQAAATKTVIGGIYQTFYAKKNAILADGTIKEVAFDETSNGGNAVKYQDTYTANFFAGTGAGG